MNSSLLNELLSQPTAPFREDHVLRWVDQFLKKEKIPFFVDPSGNRVVGASSEKDYIKLLRQKSSEPVRLFMAHTDHPGFHGQQWLSPTELQVKWYGGTPTQNIEGATVGVFSRKKFLGTATIKKSVLTPAGTSLQESVLEWTLPCPYGDQPAESLAGAFSFRSPVWRENDLIYTQAADDLVGVFAILMLFLNLKKRRNIPVIGILTRAEEVGFIGAIAHFETGWLQQARRPVLCVSLETSRTLPGAEIGKGPVVRLGDRTTVFDPGALQVLSQLATTHLPTSHQKRIMDGGSCEATAASAYGFRTLGISVPLGNYHNQNLEGGPDSRGAVGSKSPAPEFVHSSDIDGLITLCEALIEKNLPWADPWLRKRKGFKAELKKSKSLLKGLQT